MVMLAKLLHPKNAYFSMLVTFSGISTLVKLVHPENAKFPMLVTLSEIVMSVKRLQL